jgi:phage terminase large subunit-like protein
MAAKPAKAINDYIFDWDSYGQAVLSGQIPVSKWTRLGVERHYNDLKTGHLRGLFFSEAHAQHALETFLFLKHSKGEWAGQDFVPSPWQVFWIAVAFGWLKQDRTRRFREVWEEIPRKNGKSTKLSGIGLHLFYFDGEGGSEVYTCATKMDQAKITHSEAIRMVQNSPHLKRHIGINKDKIYNPDEGRADVFIPLGRDSKSLDGLNPHGAIFDEVHAHPNGEIYNVIKSGIGARKQPLLWSITTAGFDLSSFGYEQHQFAEKVLQGDYGTEFDDFLAIIYTVDDPSDWTNPLEWQKANPNWGVTVYEDRLAINCNKAIRQVSEEVNFKTKHLNIWLTSGQTWIRIEDWQQCANTNLKLSDFKGRPCWLGLDLAEKSDLASTCLIFKTGKTYSVFFKFYLNRDEVKKEGNDHFLRWERAGELTVTEGNATDFNVIRDDLRQFDVDFKIQEIAYDPKFAAYFAAELIAEGFPMVEIAQTATHFTLPIIEIENMVLTGDLEHEGKKSMDWQMTNVVMRESKFSGLKHPTKEKRELKIDGPVSMLIGMGRALNGDAVADINDFLSDPISG